MRFLAIIMSDTSDFGWFLTIHLRLEFSSPKASDSSKLFPSVLALSIIFKVIVQIMSMTMHSANSVFLASGGLGQEKIQMSGWMSHVRLSTSFILCNKYWTCGHSKVAWRKSSVVVIPIVLQWVHHLLTAL